MWTRLVLLGLLALSLPARATRLENLSWAEAEKVLKPDTIVVIPIGAGAKEHGLHLKLQNDFLLANYFADRIQEDPGLVVAPTVNYHYYPAFLEYPGSTSLRLETARDLLVDICDGFLRHGVKRFYALNTGVSTLKPLKLASEVLAKRHALLRYTDLDAAMDKVIKAVSQQPGGTHADEIETSLMLFIAPNSVDMKKAVKDFNPDKGSLTRDPKGKGTYSPTGAWGDPTLATKEKGEKLSLALLEGIRADLAALAKAKVP